MIKQIGRKYVVLSEKTGRRFGTYATLAAAEKRLRQIEMFKRLKQAGARPRRRSPAGRAAGRRGAAVRAAAARRGEPGIESPPSEASEI